ncbi:hypothetical protein LSAT2_012485 [Lamellibrachia satsuma]|nr:hypothetical protein LSAT2_012485 [Lamellibrachia satsuma]
MLLYIAAKAFPLRTFVVRVQPNETIARIRAQLLHILYELGRDSEQFRLRYKGEYLRDAYTCTDYNITESALLKMIPLSFKAQSVLDDISLSGVSDSASASTGLLPDVHEALTKEVRLFTTRERLLFHFKSLQYVLFMGSVLSFFTTHWYSAVWSIVLWAFAVNFCPSFTRYSGFIGKQSVNKTFFCVIYGFCSLASAAAFIYFASVEITRLAMHGCKNPNYPDNCSAAVMYSAIFFCIHIICLVISAAICWQLLWNMKVEYGDYVEKCLVQNRDIEQLMQAAKQHGVKVPRIAAFELATMAAASDDNKFRIVAEGGLEVLTRLALCSDEPTQEHAVETIAELMTIPAIQDTFVEMGGVRTLTALLRSKNHRIVYQVTSALSYIVSDSDDNKNVIVTDHGQGLEDLCYAAHTDNLACQRLIAGVFLELVFDTDIRMHMASLNTPAEALITLCKSADLETKKFALQTFELLAIESSDMICAQEELLKLLLELPSTTADTKIYILAGKILLYFAENKQSCEMMLDEPSCKKSLARYAHCRDPVMQKVIIKIIFSMLELPDLRYKVEQLQLGNILTDIREQAADREMWDMADQALQVMSSDDDILGMPEMSTREKMDKMSAQPKVEQLKRELGGSQSSLRSRVSLHSSMSGSLSDVGKEPQ